MLISKNPNLVASKAILPHRGLAFFVVRGVALVVIKEIIKQ